MFVYGGALFARPGRDHGRHEPQPAGAVRRLARQGHRQVRRLLPDRCTARYALADGGWWGVGLGASREKWQWLPEAHNDFIFAILGEELGLPGTLVLLGLFCALALVCYRIVLRTNDMFVRIATAGVMAWIVGQAHDQHRRGHRPAAGHRGARCRWSPPAGRP